MTVVNSLFIFALLLARGKVELGVLIALPILMVTSSLCLLFGIAAIRNRVAYTRYGNVVEGSLAVFQGVILLVVSFASGCMFLSLLPMLFVTGGPLGGVWSRPGWFRSGSGPRIETVWDRQANKTPPSGKSESSSQTEEEFKKAVEEARRRMDRQSDAARKKIHDDFDKAMNEAFNDTPAFPERNPALGRRNDEPMVRRGSAKDADLKEQVNTGRQSANETPDVANPENAGRPFPAFKYDLLKAQKSPYFGVEKGDEFDTSGPPGSLLVGMRVGADAQGGICSMQPIFQLQGKYVYGPRLGDVSARTNLLLADAGYVVGTVLVSSDTYLQSLQLRFVKLEPGNAAKDVFQQYDSRKVGRSVGAIKELDPKDWHIIGLFGKCDDSRIYGVGLSAVLMAANEVPSEFRTWRSRNGQYSVEAKLQSLNDGKLVLEKRDGTTVEVVADSLSDEDQNYVRNR